MRLIPHTTNGIWDKIGVSSTGYCLGIGSNFWHFLHFFIYSAASYCKVGQKYPWHNVLRVRVFPPWWSPQILSWISVNTYSASGGCRHQRRGEEADFLYRSKLTMQYLAANILTSALFFGHLTTFHQSGRRWLGLSNLLLYQSPLFRSVLS